MIVVDPTFGLPAEAAAEVALPDVDWQRDPIVLFSNSKPNAAELLRRMGEKLGSVRENPSSGFVEKSSASRPAPPEMLDEVAGRHRIALMALADCGSCSTWTFQDSMELAKRGVVCLIITTTSFESLVRMQAEANGAKPQLVVLDHPVAGLSHADLSARVDQGIGVLGEVFAR